MRLSQLFSHIPGRWWLQCILKLHRGNTFVAMHIVYDTLSCFFLYSQLFPTSVPQEIAWFRQVGGETVFCGLDRPNKNCN